MGTCGIGHFCEELCQSDPVGHDNEGWSGLDGHTEAKDFQLDYRQVTG